ncbi:MAG: hypothetical protein HRU48_04345 [Vibrio sp.]|uniref:hypothetical protein n=1 Tax=Vibrio TaxID=662 RepID=UPI001EC94852|nr:hypothetical protein [Vibrio sp.]NRB66590.1 hypothetical protein [Vibrio sp.]
MSAKLNYTKQNLIKSINYYMMTIKKRKAVISRKKKISRATVLSSYILACDEMEELSKLIDSYVKKSINDATLIKLATKLSRVGSCSNDRKLLSGGGQESSSSSLRSHVSNAYKSSYNNKLESLNKVLLPTDNYDNSFTIPVEHLTQSGTASASAHAVVMYKHNFSHKIYFGKKISEHERSNALAEVLYSEIWREIIGYRASKSLCMVDGDNNIIGICSEALPNFKEVKKVLNSCEYPKEMGLLSIVLLSYLLVEDDLHIKNIGLCTINGRTVFGKIDHDYIVSKWEDKKNHFESSFPLNNIIEYINSGDISSLKIMANSLRFSPGKANSLLLRAGHKIRGFTGTGANTTLGKRNAKSFYSNYACINDDCARDFLRSRIKLFNYKRIERVLNEMSLIATDGVIQNHGKIGDIYDFLKFRIRYVQKNLV